MKKSDSDKTGRWAALSENYSDNVKLLTELLRSEHSFDMLTKTLTLSDGELTLFFIDGFAKDTVLQKLMMHFLSVKKLPDNALDFMQSNVPYVETDATDDPELMLQMVLSGATVVKKVPRLWLI